jgi:hypothetical protein
MPSGKTETPLQVTNATLPVAVGHQPISSCQVCLCPSSLANTSSYLPKSICYISADATILLASILFPLGTRYPWPVGSPPPFQMLSTTPLITDLHSARNLVSVRSCRLPSTNQEMLWANRLAAFLASSLSQVQLCSSTPFRSHQPHRYWSPLRSELCFRA